MEPWTVVSANTPLRWTGLVVAGDDALTFLQGQVTQDITRFATESWTPAALLTPSGELLSPLWGRQVEGGVVWAVPEALIDIVETRLTRFRLRTRVEFSRVEVDTTPVVSYGEALELGWPGPAEVSTPLPLHAFGDAFVDATTSFVKGCYTGQELVGRLDARGGNTPFRLAVVDGVDVGDMVTAVTSVGPTGERALQRLTTVVQYEGFVRAFAIVHRSIADATFTDVVIRFANERAAAESP